MATSYMVTGAICTRQSLAADFTKLGLKAGDTVLVHSSLKSLGWVCGGAEAVIWALLDVLGREGTLVVPTHTSDNSDPAEWKSPPVPKEWYHTIRKHMPAYDSRITRTREMGAIPELLRTWPGALRTAHPQTSFAALGPLAEKITSNHALEFQFGEESPLARLENVNARVLLIGVGYETCTAFHLAEYRIPSSPRCNSFAVYTDKGRQWLTVDDICLNDDENVFNDIGQDLEDNNRVTCKKVGAADARLFSMRDAVQHAHSCLSDRQWEIPASE